MCLRSVTVTDIGTKEGELLGSPTRLVAKGTLVWARGTDVGEDPARGLNVTRPEGMVPQAEWSVRLSLCVTSGVPGNARVADVEVVTVGMDFGINRGLTTEDSMANLFGLCSLPGSPFERFLDRLMCYAEGKSFEPDSSHIS